MGYQGSGWECHDGPTKPDENKTAADPATLPVEVGEYAPVELRTEMGNETESTGD